MPDFILNHTVQKFLGERIQKISVLTGGDINKVYRIDTSDKSYVLKLNRHPDALTMFQAEEKGLLALRSTKTFHIPQIFLVDRENDTSFILLEYLKAKKKSNEYYEHLGRKLAQMHQTTQQKFGFESPNFIGTLTQLNKNRNTAYEFFIDMRIAPQIQMAKEKGFQLKIKGLFKNLETLIPEEAPALIHGDLWCGNVITDSRGFPSLIDPAVSYGSRETDIAMMLLFGGFPEKTFESYHECYPLKSGWKNRIEIWQLYYLLVHLNLFGSTYYQRVKDIVQKFN